METLREARGEKHSNVDSPAATFGERSGNSSHTPKESGAMMCHCQTIRQLSNLQRKESPFSCRLGLPTTIFQNVVVDIIASTNTSLEDGFGKMAEASGPIVPPKEPTKAKLVIKCVNELSLAKADRLCMSTRLANNPYYADFFIALMPKIVRIL